MSIGCLECQAMRNGDRQNVDDQSAALLLDRLDHSIASGAFVPITESIRTRMEGLTKGVVIDLGALIVGKVAL